MKVRVLTYGLAHGIYSMIFGLYIIFQENIYYPIYLPVGGDFPI